MASRDISRLCQAVLPPGFEQARRQLPRIQKFLEENLPEAVRHSVTLLSVTAEQIVIAANTPMVTNYLRLHAAEIQQQLRETFQLEQQLKFRTIPDAMFQRRRQLSPLPPRAVSSEAVAAIKLNAQWIEDEDLRAAMLALADSLTTDPTE
jgi:hypothetical protein